MLHFRDLEDNAQCVVNSQQSTVWGGKFRYSTFFAFVEECEGEGVGVRCVEWESS